MVINRFLLGRAAKGLFACGLVAGVFWWVAEHSGDREGTVILHVMERDVEVTLAGRVYYFREMTDEPIVLRLPAGRYHLRVRRGDSVLHAEAFMLQGGESRVLIAIRDERGVLAPRCYWPVPESRSGGD
jgi:hypothetical protein